MLLIIGGGWLTVHWKVQQPQAEMPAAPSPSAGDHSRPSIIVMPFENLSGDPGQGYFARGIAADIVRRLIRYSELTVFDGPVWTAEKRISSICDESWMPGTYWRAASSARPTRFA